MPETSILNENPFWDPSLNDSIGPDFGWEMLRRSQLTVAKPAFGQPISRLVGNGGHTGSFSWMNRSLATIEKLRRFAEEHEAGFFTLIDHDGGGRHYVGNFVGDMPYVQAGNDRYNVQGWTFEEIPGTPMLEYPSLWDRWAVCERPIDDYNNQRTAVYGNWYQAPSVLGDDGVLRTPRQIVSIAPAAGDWAAHEYRGYGFRLWAGKGPQYGLVNIAVDGYATQQINLFSAFDEGPQIVFEQTALPLDVHRVKVTMTATKDGSAANDGMLWDKIEVMK